ncbi:hypothetical protein [Cohnella sp. JJ-181]|uniref:hypothetical protein n=1 Tax=Cohnella rhizoplanae TaxID=2974897 RepID=UPI00232AFE89|nr:hypothetical protein [Cohnella sp. JJ-181]
MNIKVNEWPAAVFVETERGWQSLQNNGNGIWAAEQMEARTSIQTISREGRSGGRLASNQPQVKITLSAPNQAVLNVRLRWNHAFNQPVQILGDHWERGYGDLGWQGLQPDRALPWYAVVHDGHETTGFGVKTGPAAMCYWLVDAEGISLNADVCSGNVGVELGDRVLDVAVVVQVNSTGGQSAYETTRELCREMCDAPVMPSFPVYGGNNWYYAYGKSSHEQILEDSRFISQLAGNQPNRPFMVIDDCWQLGAGVTGNGGPWIGNRAFPDMRKLAGQMKEEGVRPGIWCRPLLTHEYVPASWILHTKQGHFLDPSHPEVLAYVKEFIGRIHDWGYELIKHDFSTYDLFGQWGMSMRSRPQALPYAFSDRSRTSAEIVLDLYRTIAEAAGDSLVIGCNTIGHLAAGIFAIQRTGDDTSGRSWERTRRMGINTLAFRMPQHGTFFSHDADCVGITSEVPWELNSRWLDILANSGTPLFVSVAPGEATPEQIEALTTAFAVASRPNPTAEPLDWLYNACPAHWRIGGDREVRYDWNGRSALPLTDNETDNWWV